jgi:hypothetical protein
MRRRLRFRLKNRRHLVMRNIWGAILKFFSSIGAFIAKLDQCECPECESDNVGIEPSEGISNCKSLPFSTHRGGMTAPKLRKCRDCGEVFSL